MLSFGDPGQCHMLLKATTLTLVLGISSVSAFGQVKVSDLGFERNRTVVTSQPAIPLNGSAPEGTTAEFGCWDSNRGFGDFAELHHNSDATITWTITSVPLQPGLNQIRIKAFRETGVAEETVVNIRYAAAQESGESAKTGTMLYRGRPLEYRVRNGLAVYQGDIVFR